MKRTSIGFCILALGACEAAQTPAVSEPTAQAPAKASPAEVIAAEPPVEPLLPSTPSPPMGELKTKRLTNKAGPAREVALLEAQCRVVEKACDPATVQLTLDGKPIALQVPGATEAAPYGDWSSMSTYRTDDGLLRLSMKFASHHQHLGLVLQNDVFEIKNNSKWPSELAGGLIAAEEWQEGAVHYRCNAFAMDWEPVDCDDLEVFIGEEQLFRDEGVFSAAIEARVLSGGSNRALRISTKPLDGEWQPVSTRIFASVEGKTVPVWKAMNNGVHSYADDGSWEVTESECRKPAELDYDDKLDKEIVRKYGKEAFTKKRFAWDGTKVVSKVVKRWTDRRSTCQTEGRCPHVYAGDASVFLGEILRDRVGKAAWANEFIEVPRELVREGTLTMRLAEEKTQERTFVDGVWLVVDGVRIEPTACASPLCERDGQTLSMTTGDAIELSFKNIPETGVIRFFASGYYVYEQ
tara:strand:+ start:26398 stop:27795 length:1398 start_codon:yes stop_codon:yes gene_type:complete